MGVVRTLWILLCLWPVFSAHADEAGLLILPASCEENWIRVAPPVVPRVSPTGEVEQPSPAFLAALQMLKPSSGEYVLPDAQGGEWKISTVLSVQSYGDINIETKVVKLQDGKEVYSARHSRNIDVVTDRQGNLESWSLKLSKVESESAEGTSRWINPVGMKEGLVEGKGTPAVVFTDLLLLKDAGVLNKEKFPTKKLKKVYIPEIINERALFELMEIVHGYGEESLRNMPDVMQQAVLKEWLATSAGFKYIRGMLTQLGVKPDYKNLAWTLGDYTRKPVSLAYGMEAAARAKAKKMEEENPGLTVDWAMGLTIPVEPL